MIYYKKYPDWAVFIMDTSFFFSSKNIERRKNTWNNDKEKRNLFF